MTRRLARLLLLVIASAGCERSGSSSGGAVVDSAGVTIVTNDLPGAELTIPEQPSLELGAMGASGPTEFFQVEDVRFLPGDRFVVADRGTEQLRFFRTDGTLLGVSGGAGRGPEEFRGLSWIRPMGDSLMAHDWGNDRVSVRDATGTLARSFRLEWTSGLLSPLVLLDDGTLLAATVRHMTELEGTGTLLERALVTRHGPGGELLDSVGRFPYGRRVVHREGNLQTTVGLPLSAYASFTDHGSGFCHVFGASFEIRCSDAAGEATRVVRVDSIPTTVGPDLVQRAFDHELEAARAAGSIARERALLRARPSMTFPDHLPAFTTLLSDDRDRLWARRFGPPGQAFVDWWVFEDGRWSARMRVSRSFTLMDVSEGRAIGVWRDELGVERIRMYRLEARPLEG